MNFNINGDEDSFFKILLSDSVDYLTLPTTYAKKFLEKVSNRNHTLVLEPKSDVKWSVKYLKSEDRYYFKDGWLKFVKDNRLQVGDFLVFWRLSASPKSTFQVFFYSPNGCIKRPITSSGDGFVKEEETSVDDDSLKKAHMSMIKVLKKYNIHHLPMIKGFWKACGLDRYDSVQLKTDKPGKIWKVEVSKYGKVKFPHLTKGWYDFWNDNEMKVRSTCQFTHVKGNLLHVRVIKRQKGGTINKKQKDRVALEG